MDMVARRGGGGKSYGAARLWGSSVVARANGGERGGSFASIALGRRRVLRPAASLVSEGQLVQKAALPLKEQHLGEGGVRFKSEPVKVKHACYAGVLREELKQEVA